jgi:hypothetical protein
LALRAAALAIPGVRERSRDGHARLTLPWHAYGALAAHVRCVAREQGVMYELRVDRVPADLIHPAASCTDEQVQAQLAGSALRPDYGWGWAMPHQRAGLAWALARPGALLKHPTGSGKTWTAIAAMCAQRLPTVIVTRASTRLQYAREVERFTTLLPFLAKPAGEVRKKDRWQTLEEYVEWCEGPGKQQPVVVLGWEALPDWIDRLIWMMVTSPDPTGLAPERGGFVVFDEAQKGKSKDRWETVQLPERDDPGYALAAASVKQRGGFVRPMADVPGVDVGIVPLLNVAQSAAQLARAANVRLATTATPVDDRTQDLWGILDLIEPGAWGNFRSFALRYCDGKEGLYGFDASGSSNAEELRNRLSAVMHAVPSEEVRRHLPAKRRELWRVGHGEQVKPSGGWERVLKAAQKAGPMNLLEARLSMAASAKRRAVVGRVSEHLREGAKVVIFTARREDCDELAEQLRNLRGDGAPAAVWCGHGGHDQEERRAMLLEYARHPGPCVLVGTGQAWGTGVDGLQCTDLAVMAMIPYTPGLLDQWEGRFTRLGQDRPVTILYPIAEGTADEHLADIMLAKLPAVAALVGLDSLEGADKLLSGHVDDPEAFASGVLAALRRAQEEGL